MRSGNNVVNGFTLNEINQMIEIVATDLSRLSMYIVRGYNTIYYCKDEINYIYVYYISDHKKVVPIY